MSTYPGLPGPLICDYMSREASRGHYAPGVEFQIGKIEMVANTGTYIDAPFHRYADGPDLAGLPLESLADLDGVVIRRRGEGGPSTERRSTAPTSDARRFWCRPDGTFTGGPSATSRITRF